MISQEWVKVKDFERGVIQAQKGRQKEIDETLNSVENERQTFMEQVEMLRGDLEMLETRERDLTKRERKVERDHERLKRCEKEFEC